MKTATNIALALKDYIEGSDGFVVKYLEKIIPYLTNKLAYTGISSKIFL